MAETKEKNNEAIKNEVEDKAKQINSIDNQTAAINDENKIVDFDSVLNNNPDLSFRINNIQKLGFSLDYIKRLVSLKSDFSVGDAESVLEDEIEKVFNSLVRAISEDKNGIILNLDGTIDEERSEFQKAELAIMDDIYAQSQLLSKGKDEQIFFQVFNEIKENKIQVADYIGYNGLDDLPRKSLADLDNYWAKHGLEKENEVSKDEEESVYIRDKQESTMMKAIYKFEREMQKNPPLEIQEQLLEELQAAVDDNTSKFADKIIDENGKVDIQKVHETRTWFEDTKNKSEIKRDLEKYLDVVGFEKLSTEDKGKIVKILAKAFMHKDDIQIQVALENISKDLELDLSFEGIQKLLQETLDVDINGIDDLKKFNAKYELNLETFEEVFGKIDEDIELDPDKGNMTAQEARAKTDERNRNKRQYKTLSKKLSYMTITSEFEKAISEGDKEAGLEFLKLYVQYNYSKNPDEKRNTDLLKEYVKLNYDYLKTFFDDNYPNLNVFYNKTINVKQISNEIENINLSEDGKNRVERIRNKINEYSQKVQDDSEELVKEVSLLIAENYKHPSEDNQKKLAELLKKVSPYALDSTKLDSLNEIKSELISKTIEERFKETFVAEGFSEEAYYKDNVKLTFLDVLEENVLILESKLENAKGKPEYLNLLNESKKTYSENPYYETIVAKYRDSDGNLTDYANKRFEEYNDRIIKEAIDNNFIGRKELLELQGEEKGRYVSFLLVGLEINSLATQSSCMEQLKLLYPQSKDIRGENFRNYIYKEVFGSKYTDVSLIDKERQNLKDNVLSQAINSKTHINIDADKILDADIEALLSENYVEMNVTGIDFSKSELQNLFNNSSVKFTEVDEKYFQSFFEKVAQNSLPSSRIEALKQYFLTMHFYKEELETNKELKINLPRIEAKMEKLLRDNPELADIVYDENGKISEKVLEESKKFRASEVYSELMYVGKKILENPQSYEELRDAEKTKLLETGALLYKFSKSTTGNPECKKMLEKFASAILEKASSSGRQIVKFDENGNPSFQENEWQKEYKVVGKTKGKNFSETYKEVYNKHYIYKIYGKTNRYAQMMDEDFKEAKENMDFNELLEFKSELENKLQKRYYEKATQYSIERRTKIIQEEVLKLNESDINKIRNPYLLAIWYEEKYENAIDLNEQSKIEKLFKQNVNSEKEIGEMLGELKDKMSNSSVKGKIADRSEISNALGEGVFETVVQINKDKLKEQIFNPQMQLQDNNTLISDIASFDRESIDEFDNLTLSAIWYNKAITDAIRRNQHNVAVDLSTKFSVKFKGQDLQETIQNIKANISEIIDGDYISSNDVNESDVRKKILGEDIYNFINNNKGINKKCDREEQKLFDNSLDEFLGEKDKNTKIVYLASLYKRCVVSENTGINPSNRTMHFENYMLKRKEDFEEFFNEDGTIDFKRFMEQGEDSLDNDLANFSGKLNSSYSSLRLKNSLLKDKSRFVSSHIGKFRGPKDIKPFYEGLKEILDIDDKCKENGEETVISAEMVKQLQEKETGNYFRAVTRNSQKKHDKWTDYVKSTIRLGGIALNQLPKVILGKESKSQFVERIIRHTANGVERVAGKVKNDFTNLLNGNGKNTRNALESGDKIALPDREKGREASRSKVIENQKENKTEIVSDQIKTGLDALKIENSRGQLEEAAKAIADKQVPSGQEFIQEGEEIEGL